MLKYNKGGLSLWLRRLSIIGCLLSVGTSVAKADDALLTGTPISSSAQLASPAEKAFDGDVSTFFKANSSNMAWVGLDLGTPHVITRIEATPRDGISSAQHMTLAVMEGANQPDFSDALPLYLISGEVQRGATASCPVEVSRGFRYVRFVGTAGSNAEMAELKFYGHEGEGDDTHLYQVTNLPTVSIHMVNNRVPSSKGTDYEGNVTIVYENGTLIQEYPVLVRVRGNFSASHENKPYRIKFNDGKSHHMLHGSAKDESPAKAKKWTLINNYGDKTLFRNNVAFEISRRAQMPYTPWCRNVDVLLNGEYRGCYQLTDWLGIDDQRVDIDEMTPDDVEGDALTGGYFFEMNGYANSDPVHFTSNHGNTVTVHSPDEDEIVDVQFKYIRDHFNAMEARVYADNYDDDEEGYRALLDLDTFLRYFLACEYAGNTDMIWQVFMYKQRGDDHIYTGPVWDNDLALDNDGGVYPGNKRAEWTYPIRCAGNWGNFVSRILSDGRAMARLQEIWAELRDAGQFEPGDMRRYVENLRYEVNASQKLNFIRWPYLLQQVHCNPRVWGSWDAEVDVVSDYVYGRVAWMDKKLNYNTLEAKNGVYQLNSPLDLATLSKLVNNGKILGKVRAVLNTDMDMAQYNDRFAPIGTESHPFKGSIDGQGHTISNLHVAGDTYVGLLGVVSSTVELRNIHIDSSCTFEGSRFVGALVGYMADGDLTVTACSNEASVDASVTIAGGLVGGIVSGPAVFTNCFNVGSIHAAAQAAAIIGYGDKTEIVNCYNAGIVNGSRTDKEFALSKSLKTTNCYDTQGEQVERVTTEQVKSGALCWKLNEGVIDKNGWRQNIDNTSTPDDYPVYDRAHGVVYPTDGNYSNHDPNALAYRYYKLEITKIKGGSTIQLSEFDLLDETLNEVNKMVVYEGTSSNISNEDWPNIADNKTSTKFCSIFGGNATFLFDAGSEISIRGYRMYTANDTQSYSDRNPVSWNLYVSNEKLTDMDDARWLLVDSRTDDTTLGATNFTPYDFSVVLPSFVDEPMMDVVQPADDRLYDLMGRPVSADEQPTPGIYIRNGQKIFVK